MSCQEKSVTNYLCLSLKEQLWKHSGWVYSEDAKGAVVGAEENELVVVSGRAEGRFSLRAFVFVVVVSQSCS